MFRPCCSWAINGSSCKRFVEFPPRIRARRRCPQFASRSAIAFVMRKCRSAATELFARLQQEAQVVTVLGDEALTKQYPGVAAIVNGQQVSIASVAARMHQASRRGSARRRNQPQVADASASQERSKQVTEADIDAEIARAAISYGFVRRDGTAEPGRLDRIGHRVTVRPRARSTLPIRCGPASR